MPRRSKIFVGQRTTSRREFTKMERDPEASTDGSNRSHGVAKCLDMFQNSPSEHAKALIVREKIVPCVRHEGTHSFSLKPTNLTVPIV